jgi:hypothetical protein
MTLASSILNLRGLGCFRFLLWCRNARRDGATALDFGARNGITPLNIFQDNVLGIAPSDTLFILGNGWSVNELNSTMLHHIQAHTSIGVNFWFFHDFIPSALSLDGGKVEEADQLVMKSLGTLGLLLERWSVSERQPKIMYLRPYQSNPEFLLPVPAGLKEQSSVSGRANIVGSSRRAVKVDVKRLIKQLLKRRLPHSVLPDNGSSIVRLVFFGIAQGFKDIVLVGVDLDARPHFWFGAPYAEKYPELLSLFPPPDGKPHGTVESTGRALGNLEFLAVLGEVLNELGIARLWIGSPTSQLARILPRYDWPDEIAKDSPCVQKN